MLPLPEWKVTPRNHAPAPRPEPSYTTAPSASRLIASYRFESPTSATIFRTQRV